jgi:glycosyltransferase involved in cell wall biosynthesis
MKIALVENFGLDFLNFRVPLVKFLETVGYEVYAIIPRDKYCERVRETGVNVLPLSLKKNTVSPISFFRCLAELRHYQKEYGFSIIHSFRLQPNIISSLAFPFSKRVKIISHITGLGYAFTGSTFSSFLYRYLILLLYQIAFAFSDRIIVQNSTDRILLSCLAFTSGKLEIIEGSGIDQEKFSRENVDIKLVNSLESKIRYMKGDIIASFTGRLLIEKGILEFLAVADKLSRNDPKLKFVIAGWYDINNPSCLSPDQMNKYLVNTNIIFLGEILEIRELLYLTDILILPTYREGFPRSVLEAMSMNVAVITTDVPGAKDAIIDNYNGILVPVKDNLALEVAILKLISDEGVRKKLGYNGRYLVESKYNTHVIFNKILNVFRNL